MTEQLLHFIWKFRYFNVAALRTTKDETVSILRPGIHNHDQGPDFLDALIHVAGMRWAGSVELHLKTSDWLRHGHTNDPFYRNVILHVVWKHDVPVNDVPVLELHDRIPNMLTSRYAQLMNEKSFIPCNGNLKNMTALAWVSWKDRLLFERLERKSMLFRNEQGGSSLREETCWRMLARSAGLLVNAEAFEQVARSVPMRVIRRQRYNLQRLEALLLGQAGLLDGNEHDNYLRGLAREHALMVRKFALPRIAYPLKFLRMRPRNFPGVRLAQLAAILHRHDSLWDCFVNTGSLKELQKKLSVTAGPYWTSHNNPGRPSAKFPKHTGDVMVNNIIINAVIPVLFYYAGDQGQAMLAGKALDMLAGLKMEHNSITDAFASLGFLQDNAFDSQAVLELKKQYCDNRKCLDCAVGYSILNPRPPSQH